MEATDEAGAVVVEAAIVDAAGHEKERPAVRDVRVVGGVELRCSYARANMTASLAFGGPPSCARVCPIRQ
jgi:hypothetical protein